MGREGIREPAEPEPHASANRSRDEAADAERGPAAPDLGWARTGAAPGTMPADGGSQVRMLASIQRRAGNAAATSVVASLATGPRRATTSTDGATPGAALAPAQTAGPMAISAGPGVVQRADGDEAEEPEPEYDVTEEIGPVSDSTYEIEATTLAEVADIIGGRAEAGYVDWRPTFSWTNPRDEPHRFIVTVSVPITREMPSWTPPAEMGPRSRAEWNRWYAALATHEQGHVDRVHTHFDGLAERMAHMRFGPARTAFNTAKRELRTASDDYDTTTDHGRNAGTVLDVSIEEAENAESDEDSE